MINLLKKIKQILSSSLKMSNCFFRTKNKLKSKKSYLAKIKIGKNSFCGEGCMIVETSIGDFVSIGNRVTIGPRSHLYTNFTTHDFIYTSIEFENYKNIEKPFGNYLNKIGNGVWIGSNTIIMPGVEVGNGAIIEVGSIVTKSVPAYAVVGGNPAKFIRWRFTDEQIEKIKDEDLYDKCN